MALSFIASSGGWLSWTSDKGEPMGVSSAFIEDLASIELKAPNGQRLASLDVEGAWGGHSVNGTVTASVSDFAGLLRKEGFNLIGGITSSIPFELSVAMGNVSGYSTVDKFGINPEIEPATDPEDVWELGGTYIYDDFGTAPIVSLVSNSANDTQVVTVQGLDINGYFVSQDITLNGTTRVALTTPLWRVYRMQNIGSVDIDGTVRCYIGTSDTPTDAETRAIIEGAHNQTLMCIYTIPKGKTGYLYRGEAGMEWQGTAPRDTGDYATLHYRSRRQGEVFRVKKVISLLSSGDSNFQDPRSFPDIIPELTDIKLTVEEVSSDVGVWGTFDIMLVDN